MSETIVDANEGFGFQLTRFAGPVEKGRMYQIDVEAQSISLTDWQMVCLVSAFIKDHNEQINKALGNLRFPIIPKKS